MDYRPGLEGVIAAETALSMIDGNNGELLLRGRPAGEVAEKCSFEEAAYFLWYGKQPDAKELSDFKKTFVKYRELPSRIQNIIDELPADMEMMAVLRTAVSALGEDAGWPPTVDQAIRVTAVMPSILTYRYRKLHGKPFIEPREDLGHTTNWLYMLTGEEPKDSHVRALNAYLVLTMEHGLNASTFSARVISSTQSDLYSSITGAIGAMKGPLHGGAPSGVMEMLNAIGTKEDTEPWIRKALERGDRLMGFGHRVYKTEDPRAAALKKITAELSGEDEWLDLAGEVEKTAVRLLAEYKPGRRLYTNVEFYAAAILRAVALPEVLYSPMFTSSRVVGWTAHVLEQAENNRIFRPKAAYVGPRSLN
ncbi:MAG TPA: citrate synthase/methylcitrate synthase [Bacillales bacterium]|nr:citrate synthase/methylcitrate synthase [Bacillales bacterium]